MQGSVSSCALLLACAGRPAHANAAAHAGAAGLTCLLLDSPVGSLMSFLCLMLTLQWQQQGMSVLWH